ncbi:MAG: four helix bundle protein [Armatimonadota bacterium]|nr:four helix bundle protein [Armatimonadota bacterium]
MDLIVWQKAHAFVLQVYIETRVFPKEELYGLTSQFRRAAVSIPANIAEGFRRTSIQEKARFLNISEASLEECRYYLILANDLGYIDKGVLWEMSEEVGHLLNGYRKGLLTPNSCHDELS